MKTKLLSAIMASALLFAFSPTEAQPKGKSKEKFTQTTEQVKEKGGKLRTL